MYELSFVVWGYHRPILVDGIRILDKFKPRKTPTLHSTYICGMPR